MDKACEHVQQNQSYYICPFIVYAHSSPPLPKDTIQTLQEVEEWEEDKEEQRGGEEDELEEERKGDR